MERKKINGEEFPKSLLSGFIALLDNNPVKSAMFMADFEEMNGIGFDFNPDCNVWYRIKANIIDSVDDLKASEKDKVRLRKKFAGLVGIPVFHVGENSKHNTIMVASLMGEKLLGLDKKYLYKIESKPYMKNLKKSLFETISWDEFIKPLIYLVRGFGLDKCSSFPSIEAKRSDEEED
jgi:hypothetical protein